MIAKLKIQIENYKFRIFELAQRWRSDMLTNNEKQTGYWIIGTDH